LGLTPEEGGKRVVTASDDGTARIWNASNGRLLAEPMSHDDAVSSAVFSPDGRHLLTASGSGARFWDVATGAAVGETMSHTSISFAAFSPEGQHMATAGLDGLVKIWPMWPQRGTAPYVSGAEKIGRRPASPGATQSPFILPLDRSAAEQIVPFLLPVDTADAEGRFGVEMERLRPQMLFVSRPGYRTSSTYFLPSGRDHLTLLAELAAEPFWERWLGHRLGIRVTFSLLPILVVLGWLVWRRHRQRLVLEKRSTRERQTFDGVGLPEPRHNLY
jgi:hypothetical protein